MLVPMHMPPVCASVDVHESPSVMWHIMIGSVIAPIHVPRRSFVHAFCGFAGCYASTAWRNSMALKLVLGSLSDYRSCQLHLPDSVHCNKRTVFSLSLAAEQAPCQAMTTHASSATTLRPDSLSVPALHRCLASKPAEQCCAWHAQRRCQSRAQATRGSCATSCTTGVTPTPRASWSRCGLHLAPPKSRCASLRFPPSHTIGLFWSS